jgi:hypothetical protein
MGKFERAMMRWGVVGWWWSGGNDGRVGECIYIK